MCRTINKLHALLCLILIFPTTTLAQSGFYGSNVGNVVYVTSNTDVSKIKKSNATYIIQGDIDLKKKQWNVPSSSILYFIGGSIKNGGLYLNNTSLLGMVRFSNIKLAGTCANDELCLGWFRDDTGRDYSEDLQALHDIAKTQAIIKIGTAKYLINQPVKISKSISIKGNSTRSYKNLGEELYGSTLYTTNDINILVVTARMVVIEGLNLIGYSSRFTSNKVREGTSSLLKYSWASSGKICDCNFLQSHIGLELYHSGIMTIENNNFALCNVGIWAEHSGDCNYINNYINTCDCNGTIAVADDNVTSPNGIGILFKPGSGNSNILGGKIEWNNKGIVNAGSSGITILGVQFDYNKSGHVFYHQSVMQYDSGFNGNSIVGCRFLGTPGDQHIYVRYMTTTKINVTGNFFSCSGRGASDNNKEGKVGPARIFSVYERHLDNKYKNTCTISFGSNSHINISKLGFAMPQVNNKTDKGLIKIITPDNSLSSDGFMTVVGSDITN